MLFCSPFTVCVLELVSPNQECTAHPIGVSDGSCIVFHCHRGNKWNTPKYLLTSFTAETKMRPESSVKQPITGFHRWWGAQKVSVKNAKCQRKSFPTFSGSLTWKCVSFWLIDTNVGFNDLSEVFHVLLWWQLYSLCNCSVWNWVYYMTTRCVKNVRINICNLRLPLSHKTLRRPEGFRLTVWCLS